MRALGLLLIAACASESQGQHEITAAGELLTSDGRLREPGWSPSQLLHFDAALVHDPARLRQWDFFTVESDQAAVNLTLTDLGFLQVATIGVLDFAAGGEPTQTVVIAGEGDTFSLSPAVEGETVFTPLGSPAPVLRYVVTADSVEITLDAPGPSIGLPASGRFTLARPAGAYLSCATPFDEDPYEFFYEAKLPGLRGGGSITVGDQTWTFDDAIAVEDWGRGAWPSEATWRWAGGSGGELAFNLGEGFGNDAAASENLLVVDGEPVKLGRVSWTFDREELSAPWTFVSEDGRVALTLQPLAPETGGLDLGSKYQRVHKAYGRFSGTIELADRTLQVTDLLGFAEEVELSW